VSFFDLWCTCFITKTEVDACMKKKKKFLVVKKKRREILREEDKGDVVKCCFV